MLQKGMGKEEKYILLPVGILAYATKHVCVKAKAYLLLLRAYDKGYRAKRLTLFFILTKITMQMAMRSNVTTTPTRTPSTGVI